MRTAYADIPRCILTSVCVHTRAHTNMQSENNVYWWRAFACVKLRDAVHQVTAVVISSRAPGCSRLPHFLLAHQSTLRTHTHTPQVQSAIHTPHRVTYSWSCCDRAQLPLVVSSITYEMRHFDTTWFLVHFANLNKGGGGRSSNTLTPILLSAHYKSLSESSCVSRQPH